MAQQKHNAGGNQAKVGLGIGLAAAAIAGAYYLYGTKEGAKRRTKIQGWTLRAKGEVLERLENLKDVNEDAYNNIVDTVTERYKKVKGVDVAELALLAQDLKKHWTSIRRQMQASNAPKKKPAAKKASPKKAPAKAAAKKPAQKKSAASPEEK
jgi:hypothetical protein